MNHDDQQKTDPCRAPNTFSPERFSAFMLLFIVMLGVGSILFFLLGDAPYGPQLATAVSYTAAVMVYGFAKNRNGIQLYLFTCPVVVSQYPRLLKRHAGFLAALIIFESIALRIKPHLSAWWLTSSGQRGWSPFFTAVAVPIGALAITEILTNRGVLKRAHEDEFGEDPGSEDSEKSDSLSIAPRG